MGKALVCGGGALGSLFAYYLSAGGHTVWVLERYPRRLEQLRQGRVLCRTLEGGVLSAPVAVVQATGTLGVDVVFVTVKYYHTADLVEVLRPLAERGVPLVSLQNGFAGLDLLRTALPQGRFVQGATEMGARLMDDGVVIEEARGITHLCGHDADVRAVTTLLQSTALAVSSPDGCTAIWKKFALICGLATVSALLSLDVGDVVANPEARELALEMAREAARLARALGVDLRDEEVRHYVLAVADTAGGHIPSLLADVLAGRPTEAPALCGYVARKSEELGIEACLSSAAYRILTALEHSYHRRIIPAVGRQLSLF